MKVDEPEAGLVRKTVSSILTEPDAARGASLLLEAGIEELLAADASTTVQILQEEHGRQLSSSPVLDLIILAAWGVDAGAMGVVHPAPHTHGLPPGRIDGDELHVEGISMAPHGTRVHWVVAANGEDLRLVQVPESQLVLGPAAGIDLDLGVRRATARCQLSSLEVNHSFPGLWESTVALAQRGVGHELVATARRMLEIALDHVTVRSQFGRPIAEFQSVRHRLAEVAAELVAAEELLELAWLVEDDTASLAAKVQSGRTSFLAARHAQQVCGGIGFTWEHGLHRFVRRAYALDAIYGASHLLEVELGERLLLGGRVPRFGHVA